MENGMILFLLIGIVVGGAMGYLIAIVLGKKTIDPASQELHLTLKMEQERSVSLQGDLELLNATVKEERENTLRLNGQNATLTANLLNLKEKLEDQKKEVLELQNKFSMEFKNLANDIFEEKTKKFTEQNKTNLGEILTPLKERIEKFEHQVERNNKESIQWNTALKTQLDHIKELNKQMTVDTENLTRALKGDAKTQGNWGEILLESILEKVGLTKNVHYFKEQNFKAEDGNNQRLDYILKLPDDKCLVIDSKVSLTAYTRYNEEDVKEKKAEQLKLHMDSILTHIKTLSARNYQNLYQIKQPDYVLMFVANEPALSVAFQEDDQLYEKALDKNIVLVSTSTLLATLRTVSYIWKQDAQTKNAVEIARQAGAMYDKFTGFVEDLLKLGSNLKTTQGYYEEAMKKLIDGKGNLIKRAEDLKKLGAKATKQLDSRIVDRSGDDSDPLHVGAAPKN
ncbi:MAG: DNA recombination protein RmuC [Flammeovirgaceae bacterium]|jgi:DNA recombination protein RmuC|nr:DNA recombination protein RmuC [Flammeovirgaceae bacterium]|tara:strand:- start:30355 stop:31716 length:1362 start_codon:yes stop_codon:yes gene_type:complete